LFAKEFQIPIEEVYVPDKVFKWKGTLDEVFWKIDKELDNVYYFQDYKYKLGNSCKYWQEQCSVKFDCGNKLKYVSIGLGENIFYNNANFNMPPKRYDYLDGMGRKIVN